MWFLCLAEPGLGAGEGGGGRDRFRVAGFGLQGVLKAFSQHEKCSKRILRTCQQHRAGKMQVQREESQGLLKNTLRDLPRYSPVESFGVFGFLGCLFPLRFRNALASRWQVAGKTKDANPQEQPSLSTVGGKQALLPKLLRRQGCLDRAFKDCTFIQGFRVCMSGEDFERGSSFNTCWHHSVTMREPQVLW